MREGRGEVGVGGRETDRQAGRQADRDRETEKSEDSLLRPFPFCPGSSESLLPHCGNQLNQAVGVRATGALG